MERPRGGQQEWQEGQEGYHTPSDPKGVCGLVDFLWGWLLLISSMLHLSTGAQVLFSPPLLIASSEGQHDAASSEGQHDATW